MKRWCHDCYRMRRVLATTLVNAYLATVRYELECGHLQDRREQKEYERIILRKEVPV